MYVGFKDNIGVEVCSYSVIKVIVIAYFGSGYVHVRVRYIMPILAKTTGIAT